MNPLLEQFLSEAREFLQGIGEKLMLLEHMPGDAGVMNELFRLVHTLKGNSGLFDFSEMTRVLHAGEDLMDDVKNGRVAYSQALADQLLEAMDFVDLLCDEIESEGRIDASRAADSVSLAEGLRALMASHAEAKPACAMDDSVSQDTAADLSTTPRPTLLVDIPESVRMEAYRRTRDGDTLYSVAYTPVENCFYQGDDPFFTARQTPGLLWGSIVARESWPPLAELDAYRCALDFHSLTAAFHEELLEHYRYTLDQVSINAVDPLLLVIPQGQPNGGPAPEEFKSEALRYLDAGDLEALKRATQAELDLGRPEMWNSSALRWLLLLLESAPGNGAALRSLVASLGSFKGPDWESTSVPSADTSATKDITCAEPLAESGLSSQTSGRSEEIATALADIFDAQRLILMLDDHPAWQLGRLKAVGSVLSNCCKATGEASAELEIAAALQQSLAASDSAPLLAWLNARDARAETTRTSQAVVSSATPTAVQSTGTKSAATDGALKFNRRADDALVGPKSFRVDQIKVDRLMNLIGEMVVSKNALPYLAQRAENQFGVRDLAREIRAQYTVINRIAEEMQDAIMQVRMMAVSTIFQRFPRLVRDISHSLGKEVLLTFEGEETEADKNIIESLADPLIHIIRNSLDHGLELPAVRRASGKPPAGNLTIRAAQEGDRVLIEIIDDGKGIDPAVTKRIAYEKGVIDESTLERISDREAINLVFAVGFSTAEKVSDLSGRGVGMDVVRTAVEKVNGTIVLESEVGKGTCIRISLPLSMAVTQVMIVESDRQMYGVPMSHVVETVRVPRSNVHTIKHRQTTVLRERIVPLKSLNALLNLPAEPKVNGDDELAVLVVRVNGEVLGLLVDNFRESVDVIQKPLTGVLSGLLAYSGSALMGDGSVLMVLDVKELV